MPKVLSKYESRAGRLDEIGSPWVRPEFAMTHSRRRLVFGKTEGHVRQISRKFAQDKQKKEREAKKIKLELKIIEAKCSHYAAMHDMEKEMAILKGTDLSRAAHRGYFLIDEEKYEKEGEELAAEFVRIFKEKKLQVAASGGDDALEFATDLDTMIDDLGLTKPHQSHFHIDGSGDQENNALLKKVQTKLSSVRLLPCDNARGTTPLFGKSAKHIWSSSSPEYQGSSGILTTQPQDSSGVAFQRKSGGQVSFVPSRLEVPKSSAASRFQVAKSSAAWDSASTFPKP